MNEPLIAWQWKLYPTNHLDRRNLVMHLVTVPLFWAATLTLLASPLLGLVAALGSALTLVAVIALQGRTHGLEVVKPVPFRGPFDVLLRIFAEQFFTFPRFVLTGGLARAWRSGAAAGFAKPASVE